MKRCHYKAQTNTTRNKRVACEAKRLELRRARERKTR